MPSATPKPAAKRSSWRAKRTVVDKNDPERQQLLAAAKHVLERSGWWGFKVDSVLRHARLSTRSFYRHFDKKSDLLLALLEMELGGAAVKLQRVTAAADSPSERIRAYVTATIDMAYRTELAKPSSLFASHWREMLPEYGEEIGHIIDEMAAPLVDAIADGVRTGELTSDDPKADAKAIFYLVAGMTADEAVAGGSTPREEMEHIVLPFIGRAIGLK
jgi:AcrR family transcriptional regulator